MSAILLLALTATLSSCEQDSASGVVTVRYALDEPAVVTVDFQTNRADGAWVSIGEKNFLTLAGDVNRYVAGEADRVLRWHATEDWPGHALTAENFRAVLTPWATNDPPAYMCVDVCDVLPTSREYTQVKYYVSEAAVPGGVHDLRYVRTHLLLRKIPCVGKVFRLGGDYVGTMGTGDSPMRHVRLTQSFYMSVFPLTGGQFVVLRNDNGVMSGNCADYTRQPIMGGAAIYENLRGELSDGYDWPNDTAQHARDEVGGTLSHLRARAGGRVLFDLPTDAQYEIAAHGGYETDLGTGKPFNKTRPDWDALQETAWTKENKDDGTDPENPVGGNVRHPHNVGLLLPNGYGLYDMQGNGYSRCRDWYASNPLSVTSDLVDGILVDPVGPTSNTSTNRVMHSADWDAARANYYWVPAKRFGYYAGSIPEKNGQNYTTARVVCPAVAPAL